MDNERRANIGASITLYGAGCTGVDKAESAETAMTDVLSYVAHFCDRLGLDPKTMFADALDSYRGDFEDGPKARRRLNPEVPLAELIRRRGWKVG